MNRRTAWSSFVAVMVLLAGCTGSPPDSPDPSLPGSAAPTVSEQSGSATKSESTTPAGTTQSGATTQETAAPQTVDASLLEPGDPAEPADAVTPAELRLATGTVVLASDDGSAFAGSRTVFTLTNTATGSVITAPVDGAGPETRAEVEVPAGTYAVAAADRFVGTTGSWSVRDVVPAEVTVEAAADPTPASTVTFGLDAQRSPFDLMIQNVTANQIEVSWEALGDTEVVGYQLRQTSGAVPATAPTDGTAIELKDPAATSAVADGLSPDSDYTLTLFATAPDGQALAFRSVTATTAKLDASTPSYALAPNTIVPTDFAALQATSLGDDKVQIVLSPGNAARASATAIPGVPAEILAEGCVPGLPFLLSTAVAGDDAFYGVIESCGAVAPSWKSTGARAPQSAIIDADTPLAAVMPYLNLQNAQFHACIDENGVELAADAPLCRGTDTDGDGMKDTTEKALGSDPKDAGEGLKKFLDENKPVVGTGTAPPVDELQPPSGLGSGDVQVTVLWSTGDDLDLQVTDPSRAAINFDTKESASGGTLDRDDRGDEACVATSTPRAENVFWQKDAPRGTYSVAVTNYLNGRQACSTRVQAKVEVRVGGKIVVDKVVTVGVDSTLTFTVGAPGWQEPAKSTSSPAAHRIGAPTLSCEGVGQPKFQPHFGLGAFNNVTLTLKSGTLRWDIKAGVNITIDPEFSFEGGVSCSLDFNVNTFQLMTTPVPVNLEIAPVVEGSATGTLTLKGPKFDFAFGFQTEGDVSASIKKCGWGWFKVPCGISVDNRVSASPIGEVTVGTPEVSGEAGLNVGVGAEATLGIGIKNAFVTAKAGFAVKLKPAVAFAKISASASAATVAPPKLASIAQTLGPLSSRARAQLVTQLIRRSTMTTTGTSSGGLPVIGPLNTDQRYGICADGQGAAIGSNGSTDFGFCHDATCVDEDLYGTPFTTLQADGSYCRNAVCILTGVQIQLSTDKQALVLCPQERVRVATASVATMVEPTTPPPYRGPALSTIIQAQRLGGPIFIGKNGTRLPLIGPSTAGVCTSGLTPRTYSYLDQYQVYWCGDAVCVDDGASPTDPILTYSTTCKRARCVVSGTVVDTGTPEDRRSECEQGLVPSTSTAATSVSGGTKWCAKIGLGASLSVDLRVETFVLGWGKDRRYPLYSKDFDYPKAAFEWGNCS